MFITLSVKLLSSDSEPATASDPFSETFSQLMTAEVTSTCLKNLKNGSDEMSLFPQSNTLFRTDGVNERHLLYNHTKTCL